jgi:hypothetical protein
MGSLSRLFSAGHMRKANAMRSEVGIRRSRVDFLSARWKPNRVLSTSPFLANFFAADSSGGNIGLKELSSYECPPSRDCKRG